MFQLAPVTISLHYCQLCGSCGTDKSVFLCLVTKMSDQDVDVYSDLSSQLTNNFLSKIITGDET
jgi:transcription elongation factor Elf1